MKKLPIIILHGWRLSADKYSELQEKLTQLGHKVYTLDFPGFGKSKMPDKPLVLSDYVDFLDKYLKNEKLTECIIIAHSFGGRVALKYLAANPSASPLLILTGVPGFPPVASIKVLIFLILSKIGNIIFSLPLISKAKNIFQKILYRAARASDYANAQGVMRETFKSVIHEELLTSMEKIAVPTVLVWGTEDTIVPMSVAKRMNKTIKNSTLISIPGSTHKLPYSHVDQFITAIKPYLLDS